MILDKIENYKLYVNINQRIARAFTYILETDFSQLSLGKHLIEGEDIFALLQEYDTKEIENCKLESHKKYIDIQFKPSSVYHLQKSSTTKLANVNPNISNRDESYNFVIPTANDRFSNDRFASIEKKNVNIFYYYLFYNIQFNEKTKIRAKSAMIKKNNIKTIHVNYDKNADVDIDIQKSNLQIAIKNI